MGWKSTVNVSRSEALSVAADLLSDCSDEALADVLECLIDDQDDGESERISPRLRGANFTISEGD